MPTNVRVRNRRTVERFVTPVLSLVFGVLFLAIFAIHGDWTSAITSFVIMAVYAGILLTLRRRSEAVRLLGGDVPDERGQANSMKALAFTGQVLILVIVAMFIWELANGRNGNPWTSLGAIAGVSFVGSTVWYTRHG